MELLINGEPFQAEDRSSVRLLLTRLNLNPQQVVVELNRQILTNDSYKETELKQGDVLEIVQFVGGG